MRQPRQTWRVSEFDPWHFILCSKPAKGHAYKDVSISSVIWVHKQAWEREGKNVKRRKFSESQDKIQEKSFIMRRDFVWRQAKQGLISNKKLQDIWFSSWFLNAVTLKAIGRVYNGRGQCVLSYYTGAIQGRRESELKSMLHCSKHLLTGRDTEWKGLGYDIHWQGGSSSSASPAAADTQPTHSCSDVSCLNEGHTLTDSLISGNLCWIISEALTPTATAHCSSSTEEIHQLPVQAGKSLQLLNTAANLLSRQSCLHLFITTMNPH